MEIRLATLIDVTDVACSMRESDRREIFATRWDDDPRNVANDVFSVSRFAWVACYRGRPTVALGAIEESPGVFQVWMFATDDWPRVSRAVTRFAKRDFVAALVGNGGQRAYCRTIEGYDLVHRWLERLGARRESEQKLQGKNGESFYTYVWLRTDFEF